MNSPFAAIINQIGARIKEKVPKIKHYDCDWGQLDYYQGEPPVLWPCLLIDLVDFDFENRGENVQDARGKIVLRLAYAPYSSSSAGTPELYRQKALAFLDLEAQVHKALQGWAVGDEFGVCIRENTTTEKREDPIRVRQIIYSVTFEDYSTLPDYHYWGGDYSESDYDQGEYGGGKLPVKIETE